MEPTPYAPPPSVDAPKVWRNLLIRVILIVVHVALIVAFVFVTTTFPPFRPQFPFDPETSNDVMARFGFFSIRYGFLSVLAILAFDIVLWVILRLTMRGRTRWPWFIISLIGIPLISWMTFIVMAPVVHM